MRYMTSLAFVLSVLALTASAAAQGQTASISGQLVLEGGGPIPNVQTIDVFVLPADLPQPVDYDTASVDFDVHPNEDGFFTYTDLAPGDYLVVPDSIFTSPLGASVTFTSAGETFTFNALRVTVGPGENVTGLVITLQPEPQPCPAGGVCPLSPPLSPALLPSSGFGPNLDGGAGAYLGAAIAGAAIVLLGGGIALRVRQRRPASGG